MTFRTSRKPALVQLAEAKELRRACQTRAQSGIGPLTLSQLREHNAKMVRFAVEDMAKAARNRQQSAEAQSEQQ